MSASHYIFDATNEEGRRVAMIQIDLHVKLTAVDDSVMLILTPKYAIG